MKDYAGYYRENLYPWGYGMDDNELLEALRRYFAHRDDVAAAVLFGSVARGEASAGSDADIGVLFRSRPALLGLGALVTELEDIAAREVDLIDLGTLPEQDPLLAYQIAAHGVVLKDSGAEEYTNFKTRAFVLYFDIQPMLTAARAALERRLASGGFARPIHA